MAKPRTQIPTQTAAAVLFAADRTCCVCRERAKPIQIHHTDEDPTNHDPANLAVVCLDCHEKTQVKGGFSRRLDGEQVILYRDDWNRIVAGRRSTNIGEHIGRPTALEHDTVRGYDASLATTLVEVNRDAENWTNLAFLYDGLGNDELRDKAVEKAIAAGINNEMLLRLRGIQGRLDDVGPEIIVGELDRHAKNNRYREQASLHVDLGQYRAAAEVYIRGLAAETESFSVFTLAHHLNELVKMGVIPGMFVEALEKSADENDLWWQVRALEELEWEPELHELVLDSEQRIETDPDLEEEQRVHLRLIAATAKGDKDAYREARVDQERIDAQIDWNS